MKCFENPSPNINGNEYVLNKKSKTIYNHIKKKANKYYLKSGQNSTGTIKYDKLGKITKVMNYNTLQQITLTMTLHCTTLHYISQACVKQGFHTYLFDCYFLRPAQ